MYSPSDFEAELGQIDRDISELEPAVRSSAADSQTTTQLAYRLYQRGSLSGSFDDLERTNIAINDAIGRLGPLPDLYFLKANLDLKFHRLEDVRRDLGMAPGLHDSPQGRVLEADLDFQEGRYENARESYEAVISSDRTWDKLARLAYLNSKIGNVADAEQLYLEAEDELTAKEMRSYAWVELQRGVLDLSHGNYENAYAHYERASQAYSGYWLVEEHMAELLGAQREFDKAIALYESVIEHAPRPEFHEALGELYALMDKPEQAQKCQEAALAAYLESVRRSGVHYYHHLADFYADVREDGTESLKWARKDVNLRANFSTLAALAWAFYRDGQFTEAANVMRQALSSGVRDAQVFSRAAAVHHAVGATAEGDKYLQMASEINPHYRNFHVHR